ncbi:protein-S-isoprenylcysteine O-methyltransferase Ste14 [Bradyrhizobium diazoefficiens]|uniref:methyltransferase family protein n=1 Tax=Bradyrhizobium diazoefficiens TaxID=1355477 RepID=UPI00272D3D29|nr:isoprenylcysteine carboxylmethyltransferase family protein [Bradyrhizobium diazoefficiens]WLA60239.1 isoprenylcysteine carboxylmethyltransferase family protein [Bradyrhizobium diazoefficiens]
MGLVLNLIVQTIVWFGFMGAIIFGAAGTTDYTGGWLYLGVMVVLSVVFGINMARVDPSLLRERLKPPLQKDQPLADKLILIPILLLIFGGMGFMAADAARWRWSAMPSSVQWAGCGLLLAAMLFIYWIMRTNSFAAPVVKLQKDRGQAVITTGPYAIVRHPMYFGTLFYVAGTSLVLGSWWGLATVLILALLFGIRIGIEEQTLRAGLKGYDDYARRVRRRLIPFIW